MKTFNLLVGVVLTSLVFSSCEKSIQTGKESPVKNPYVGPRRPMGACNPGAYNVGLDQRQLENGTFQWTWSVENTNPGNGSNGTFQDLSHWGMYIPACLPPNAIVSASYSSDGQNWHYFTPVIQSDNSQPCTGGSNVLKFDYGTVGTSISYYRLVVNVDLEPSLSTQGYYKSGSSTGCCLFQFDGIGCPVDIIR